MWWCDVVEHVGFIRLGPQPDTITSHSPLRPTLLLTLKSQGYFSQPVLLTTKWQRAIPYHLYWKIHLALKFLFKISYLLLWSAVTKVKMVQHLLAAFKTGQCSASKGHSSIIMNWGKRKFAVFKGCRKGWRPCRMHARASADEYLSTGNLSLTNRNIERWLVKLLDLLRNGSIFMADTQIIACYLGCLRNHLWGWISGICLPSWTSLHVMWIGESTTNLAFMKQIGLKNQTKILWFLVFEHQENKVVLNTKLYFSRLKIIESYNGLGWKRQYRSSSSHTPAMGRDTFH